MNGKAAEGDLKKSWQGLNCYAGNLVIIAFLYAVAGTF